jgi:Flp pilus assembly pilin Flp
MSDLITSSQDAYRNACIATFCALISAGHGVAGGAHRLKDEARGQTAAEYMGVLLLVGAIITIVVTSGVGTHIKDAIWSAVDNISAQKPDCKAEGANC